jgi:hypothetical protein
LPVAGRLTFALANADHRVSSVFAGFNPVSARLEDGERLIGRVNLKHVVAAQVADANANGTGTQLDLCGAVVKIEEGYPGIAIQIDYSRSQVEFGARVFVSP